MKPPSAGSPTALVAAGVSASAIGGAVGVLAGTAAGFATGGVAAAIGLAAFARAKCGRDAVRRAAQAPLPSAWRRWLLGRYHHYRRLPAEARERFGADLMCFLAIKRITGIGLTLEDDHRLGVAASAVTLSLGWPDYDWGPLTEVLVYPQDFDHDYGFDTDELAGQAHPWGTVILSAPALAQSFADPEDGFHVGLHEFAHLLGLERSQFGGVPTGLSPALRSEWVETVEREMSLLRTGRSALDPYGAHDPAEFFPVAVEAFFERPLAVRAEHARLYELLSSYFVQDAAAWDEDLGLSTPVASEAEETSRRAPPRPVRARLPFRPRTRRGHER